MSLANDQSHQFSAYFDAAHSDFQGYSNHGIDSINNAAFILPPCPCHLATDAWQSTSNLTPQSLRCFLTSYRRRCALREEPVSCQRHHD
jgi:hypothetical protein